MITNGEVEKLLERLGGHNDGAKLGGQICNTHPISWSLIVNNEGGFNGTQVCIACVAELHRELAHGSKIIRRR